MSRISTLSRGAEAVAQLASPAPSDAADKQGYAKVHFPLLLAFREVCERV
jgi:hypothetical protein